MSKLIVVVGGQFGSEGKGAVCRWLAEGRDVIGVRVGGPNAGHTAWDRLGQEWRLQQISITAIANRSPLFIAAGSELDLDILDREIDALDRAGYEVSSRLRIDRSATLITSHDVLAETEGLPHGEGGLTASIGSTGKGVGAARANRLMRRALTMGNVWESDYHGIPVIDTPALLQVHLKADGTILVEGTQGYGLGLHSPYYPYATSGDCRAIDFLAQAGISPWLATELQVWMALRTFPIRVAGNSGPLYKEITWEAIGQAPEHTTVTKKERRIGGFDPVLAQDALIANGAHLGLGPSKRHVRVVLTFLDYLHPELRNEERTVAVWDRAFNTIGQTEDAILYPIYAVGTGPDTIVTLRGDSAHD